MDGGMLSQDEINALLSGMDISGDASPDSAGENVSGIDSQFGEMSDTYLSGGDASAGDDGILTDVEKDAIGEVANISMGSSATTLYSLVNRKVDISTPVVALTTWEKMIEGYERPCVFIQIKYTKGLDGSNILVLKDHDVKVITSLMMGGDGTPDEGELSELHLSAISEAMNQMMGASATSLSTMLQTMIDISPPVSTLLDLSQLSGGGDIAPFLAGTFVRITFRMQIGDLVDSKIMQLYPIEFAKDLVKTFINTQIGAVESLPEVKPEPAPAPAGGDQSASMGGMNPGMNTMNAGGMGGMGMDMNSMSMNGMNMNGMNMNGMNMDMNSMNMNGMNPMMNGMMGGMNPMMGMMGGMNPMMNGMMGGMNPMMGMGNMQQPMSNVNVQPAQFQSFSQDVGSAMGHENINLIMDVPLDVTVELGRTTKSISEILNFAPGTIIDLNRIAGEPIDVLVNGKFVAKGEVVVIEESFAVRINEIIK